MSEFENSIMRRFALIDKEKEKAFLTLVKQKGLTRENVILILSTVKLKSDAAG